MKLIDALKPEQIKIPLLGETKEDVLKELIEVLHHQQLFSDPETVFRAVIEREKIMTTGVGKGIAIPHCKNSDCREFGIALGIQPGGVDFASIDELPAKVIFLLIGPDNNPGMHIRLLSRISRLISKNLIKEQLIACHDRNEAYDLLRNEEEKYFEIAS